MNKLDKAISEGFKFLHKSQQLNGSFLSFSSSKEDSFDGAAARNLTFLTALILLCLTQIENDNLEVRQSIVKKAINFFLQQKSPYWTYNYWIRNSPEAKKMPYPDDLDDTFCILAAIWHFRPDLIDGEVMAKVVSILMVLELKEGGPYRTWIVPKNSDKIWQDVDVAVNTNILYFFSLQDIELPKTKAFIELNIQKKTLNSPYYYGSLPVIYFLSRFCQNDKLKEILLLEKQDNKREKNALEAALIITSAINIGIEPKKVEEEIKYLLSAQKNGKWAPFPFVVEFLKNIGTTYSGSSELTTAFCLEALNKYKMALLKKTKIAKLKNNENLEQEKIYSLILKQIKKRLLRCDKQFREKAFAVTLEMTKNFYNQIILAPYLFKASLGNYGKNISSGWLINLGTANLLGWVSYGLYDNFLDNEGDPKTIPVANFALREFTDIAYTLLPKESGFIDLFKDIINKIDNANYWEVNHCRLKIEQEKLVFEKKQLFAWKNYKRLAERSLGLTLGPLAILYKLGLNSKTSEGKNTLKFFTHYLIAKQLNDDAHDFEKDLKMGHLSPVAALLLKRFLEKEKKLKTTANMEELLPLLQELFWREVVIEVCCEINKHIKVAKQSLLKISLITDFSIMEKMLIPLEYSTQKALSERKQMLKFLGAYQDIELKH